MNTDDLVAYLDREIEPEQAALIEQQLARDPALRETLASLIRQRVLLAEICADQGAHHARTGSHKPHPRQRPRPLKLRSARGGGRRTLRSTYALPLMLGAAGLVVTLALFHVADEPRPAAEQASLSVDHEEVVLPRALREPHENPQVTPAPSAPLAIATGELTVQRGGAIVQVAAGDRLVVDDIVASVAPSGLRYTDGSTLALAAGSRLRLAFGDDGGKRLTLLTGELQAEVAHQGSAAPLQISANLLTAIVIGTQLSVQASAEQTRVAVRNGVVQVRGADGTNHELTAGMMAVAAPGRALQISSRSTWSLADRWSTSVTGGTLLRDPAGKASGVRSVATLDGQIHAGFTPDQFICIQDSAPSAKAQPLVRLAEDFAIVMQVQAERAGTLTITLAAEPASGQGDFHLESVPITAGTNLLTIPATRFAGLDDRVLHDYPLWALCLWGFAAGHLELTELRIEPSVTHP